VDPEAGSINFVVDIVDCGAASSQLQPAGLPRDQLSGENSNLALEGALRHDLPKLQSTDFRFWNLKL
jgi:hypothetical protein